MLCDLAPCLWERISRTTSTTLPNRLRLGPKLPSKVISDLTEAYLAKWSKSFDLSVPTGMVQGQQYVLGRFIVPVSGWELRGVFFFMFFEAFSLFHRQHRAIKKETHYQFSIKTLLSNKDKHTQILHVGQFGQWGIPAGQERKKETKKESSCIFTVQLVLSNAQVEVHHHGIYHGTSMMSQWRRKIDCLLSRPFHFFLSWMANTRFNH